MRRVAGCGWALVVVASWATGAEPSPEAAERRAIAFLAREVPAWSRENRCFSCHNNGDAARALFAAKDRRDAVPAAALADTLTWLEQPERWDQGEVDPAVSDKLLARLEFATALASAVAYGQSRNRAALVQAAAAVANDQRADGSWPIGAEGTLGAPATYGRPLATALARRTLAAADGARFAGAIGRAERWLRERPVENVLDAAAVLIGLAPEVGANHEALGLGFELLKRAQTDRGGWGPFAGAPQEAFDTALAVIALKRWPADEARPLIQRGRAFLVTVQNDDGSWTETTRPPGGVSYAERISTTGWATLALLETADR